MLHHHEVRAVDVTEVVDLHDVRVMQQRRDARLLAEHLHELRRVGLVGADALDDERRARTPARRARWRGRPPPSRPCRCARGADSGRSDRPGCSEPRRLRRLVRRRRRRRSPPRVCDKSRFSKCFPGCAARLPQSRTSAAPRVHLRRATGAGCRKLDRRVYNRAPLHPKTGDAHDPPALCRPARAVAASPRSRARRTNRRLAAMPAPAESAPPGGMPAPAESGPPAPGPPARSCRRASSPRRRPRQRTADLSYGVAARLRWVSVPGLAAQPVHQEERAAVVVGDRHRVLPAQGQLRPGRCRSATRTCRRPTATGWARAHDAGDRHRLRRSSTASRCWAPTSRSSGTRYFNEWFGIHYGAGIGVGIGRAATSCAPATTAAICTEQQRRRHQPVPPGGRDAERLRHAAAAAAARRSGPRPRTTPQQPAPVRRPERAARAADRQRRGRRRLPPAPGARLGGHGSKAASTTPSSSAAPSATRSDDAAG